MSSLSDAILTYSGNNRESLERYIESTKKDAKTTLILITALSVFFALAGLFIWTLQCLGWVDTSSDPFTIDKLIQIMLMCSGLLMGGLVAVSYQFMEIVRECEKQIEKIEYAEQFNKGVE